MRELSIEVRNGEVETVQETSSHGVGIRVFVKGKMAFSHCNDFSAAALDNAVKSAVKFAQNTTPDENNVLPDDNGFTKIEISQALEHDIKVLNRDFHVKWNEETPEPTNEDLAQYESEYNDYFGSLSWVKDREKEYIKEGCTEKELLIALWERIVEGSPEASDALEVKRQAVKERIIKPE